jgi:hypothetical protein
MPRMTIRRWIVIVTISANLLGVAIEVNRERRRASHYRSITHGYSIAEKLNRGQMVTLPSGRIVQSAASPELSGYYAEMQRKYERAASYPWLSLEPDPPIPEP